jgi:hypothetical protein
VDDEFDKGMAEVLLQILFKAQSFTKKLPSEWVYSEGGASTRRLARFVCVKDAATARHWLRMWRELPEEMSEKEAASLRTWVGAWARELGWLDLPQAGLGNAPPLDRARAVFCEGTQISLDDPPKTRGKPNTIVLLDLRLSRESSGRTYSPSEFPSTLLCREIKGHKKSLPVIIFTASRQATNYAELMEEATPFDGWLTKEAPDVPEDDENSAKSLLYLLTRLHLFSGLTDYDPDWGWTTDAQLRYLKMSVGESREKCLGAVTDKANELFEKVRADTFSTEFLDAARRSALLELRGFFSSACQALAFSDVVSVFVARRVVVATLLLTAKVKDSDIEWDVKSFYQRLVGGERAEAVKYISDYLNFREALWLRTYTPKLLGLLMPQEIEWLVKQELGWDKIRFLKNFLKRRNRSGG